jgi:hypothetical protein
MNLTSNRKITIALGIAGFLISVAAAYVFQWTIADLVWSLWLASLTVGYATLLVQLFGPFVYTPAGDSAPTLGARLKYAPFALFFVVFFTVHFGGFHYGQRVFLRNLLPLEQGDDLWSLAAAFWPMVLSISLSRKDGFAIKHSMLKGMLDPNDNGRTLVLSMFRPYIYVFKMHLLILPLMLLSFVGEHTSFTVYVLVLAVYFFPFGLLVPDEVKARLKAELEEKLKAAS